MSLLVGLVLWLAPARALRLVTFNIHGWRDEQHNDNLDRLIDLLKSLRPDVLCLNEVLHPFVAPAPEDEYWLEVRERRGYGYPPPPDSRPDEADQRCYLRRMAEALGLTHFAYGAAAGADAEPTPFRRSFFGQYPFGNAILSRHELADVRCATMQVGPADLTLGDQPRTENDLEDRQLLSARVMLPDGCCMGVCVTHLDHKAEALRERQAAEVAQHCASAFGDDNLPHVVCGDLNSFDRRDMSATQWASIHDLYQSRGWTPPPQPDSRVQRIFFDAGYEDAFSARSGASSERQALPPPTCWTMTRLDYIWLSAAAAQGPSSLRVHAHRTIQSDASDHLPIVCDLEPQPPQPAAQK